MTSRGLNRLLEALEQNNDLLRQLIRRIESLAPHEKPGLVGSRRLRLLKAIHELGEEACVTTLRRVVVADQKTIRKDLNLLAEEGLVRFCVFNRNHNPGRRGNKPKLTQKGKELLSRVRTGF
jgi:DNA-binding transcriptional ArsR family regulator